MLRPMPEVGGGGGGGVGGGRKYKLLKSFNVNVDTDANANADARGSALVLLDFVQVSQKALFSFHKVRSNNFDVVNTVWPITDRWITYDFISF